MQSYGLLSWRHTTGPTRRGAARAKKAVRALSCPVSNSASRKKSIPHAASEQTACIRSERDVVVGAGHFLYEHTQFILHHPSECLRPVAGIVGVGRGEGRTERIVDLERIPVFDDYCGVYRPAPSRHRASAERHHGMLHNGALYASKILLDGQSKNINVDIRNTGHRPVSGAR